MTCSVCQYLHNVALGLDRLASAILGGNGSQTISERLGEAEDAGKGWARWICRQLGFLDGAHHCQRAQEPGTTGRTLWDWSR